MQQYLQLRKISGALLSGSSKGLCPSLRDMELSQEQPQHMGSVPPRAGDRVQEQCQTQQGVNQAWDPSSEPSQELKEREPGKGMETRSRMNPRYRDKGSAGGEFQGGEYTRNLPRRKLPALWAGAHERARSKAAGVQQ